MLKYSDFAHAMGLPIADTNLLEVISASSVSDDTLPKPRGLDYFNYPKLGIEMVTSGKAQAVSTVLFYGPNYAADYLPFEGELPEQLVFGDSTQRILERLGSPDFPPVLVEKPDVDERLFLRLRYMRTRHVFDFVLNECKALFLVKLIAVPRPSRLS
ncbi:MAG: hypothetical protein JST44_20580 [Cyanobacteria bacterium SZAS LIN-5]|nr:hypothetical protein [Cyanobacteria bacterium SZAS LIN-5]